MGCADFLKHLVDRDLWVVVQVNGKLRGKFNAKADASDDELYETALGVENVQKFIEGKEIKKHFVIKGKVVNIVV